MYTMYVGLIIYVIVVHVDTLVLAFLCMHVSSRGSKKLMPQIWNISQIVYPPFDLGFTSDLYDLPRSIG